MKTRPAAVFLWMLIAVMCVGVISFPISASAGSADTPDAVAGARGGVYQLLGARTGSTHDVYISAGKGGAVSAGVSAGTPGRTVSVYVEPNDGYQTASIFVITAGGDTLEVHVRDGVYSFVMPDEPVVVDVTFQYKRLL